jgi:SAM-dependent methyltransferase
MRSSVSDFAQRSGGDYGGRELANLDSVAKPGCWTAAEGVSALRARLCTTPAENDSQLAELSSWICRDLCDRSPAPSGGDADAVYERLASHGVGEYPFLSGRRALEVTGYGELVDGIADWMLERFAGLACLWFDGLPSAGEHVVDLGCGSGVDRTIAARATGASGTALGIDSRPTLMRRAADLSGATDSYVVATAERCPLAGGCATLVTANGLPPLMRPSRATVVLNEIRRLLVGGGRLRFSVLISGPDSPLDCVDDLTIINAIRHGKPLAAEFRAALERAGFGGIGIRMSPAPVRDGFRAGGVRAAEICATKP